MSTYNTLFFIGLFIAGISGFVEMLNAQTSSVQDPFELSNHDKVVLLGNSLIENDLKHGYIEFTLSTRWPDRNITFRNLGWSGDTVFGDARSHYTSPPSAYELLLQQIAEAEPTVVFLAYGAIEAFDGEEGLSSFREGLIQLIEYIESLDAKPVLLSPIPQFPVTISADRVNRQNNNIRQYANVISEVAGDRNLRFLDLFHPFSRMRAPSRFTSNGIHLNETGYYHLANILEEQLGLPPRRWSLTLDMNRHDVTEAEGLDVISISGDVRDLEIRTRDHMLPLPIPSGSVGNPSFNQMMRITGLPTGIFSVSVNGMDTFGATSAEWNSGVAIRRYTSILQAREVRNMILEKNEMFFHSYRPQNRTYILGFRSHEQGQNVDELHEYANLTRQIEQEINQIRMPQEQVFRLTLLDVDE
jgi:lysophospholipase L1-like esterase